MAVCLLALFQLTRNCLKVKWFVLNAEKFFIDGGTFKSLVKSV